MQTKAENIATVEDYLKQGNQLEQTGKLEQAIEKYATALKINPNSVSARNQLAEIYENKKEFDQALVHYQTVLQQQPQSDLAHANIARVMMKQGNILDSIASYKKALALLPKHPAIVCKQLGDALTQYGEVDEAIAVYQELITLKPIQELNGKKAEAFHFGLGKIIIQLSIKKGVLHKAATCFQQACSNQPPNPWHYYHLAKVWAKQNLHDEAVTCYRKAISIQPQFSHLAYVELGNLLIRKGESSDVFQLLIASLEIKPNEAQTYKLLKLYFKKFGSQLSPNDLATKIKACLDIIEKIETNQVNLVDFAYGNMGKVFLELGQLSEAISCNKKAIYGKIRQLRPEFVNQHWEHGNLQGPNFLIIGVMKSGTTALYNYLVQHPQILPALFKEPNDIGLVQKPEKLKKNIDYYLSLFAPLSSASNFITGEASTKYIWSPEVANNILNYFPSTKLIVILRNPVKRTISQYQHNLRGLVTKENRNLEELINSELEALSGVTEPAQLIKNAKGNEYLIHGLYVYFLERWMNIFPREQFLILSNEDLRNNTSSVMKQTFEFLGVPDAQQINYIRKSEKPYSSVIDEGLIYRLYDFYQPHNQKLEEFLGRKFDWKLS